MQSFEITPNLYAPMGKRLANYIIDVIAIAILIVILTFLLGIVAPGVLRALDSIGRLGGYLVGGIGVLLYYCVMEGAVGTTLGKLITRTRVVYADGSRPNFETILVRSLWRLVPFEAFSGLDDSVFWHDGKSNTYVVDIYKVEHAKREFDATAYNPFADETDSSTTTF